MALNIAMSLAGTLNDFLVWQGIDGIVGSRDAIRQAFSKGLISDDHAWMQMLTDRNRTRGNRRSDSD